MKYGFIHLMKDTFDNYEGPHKELVKRIPDYLMVLQRIYIKTNDWTIKFLINACFSYFAVRSDIIPDNIPGGYLDDLYIATHVLADLYQKDPDVVKENWQSENSAFHDIDIVLTKTDGLLGGKADDILSFVGLVKFNEISEELNIIHQTKSREDVLALLEGDIANLVNLLRTIIIFEMKSESSKGMLPKHFRDVKAILSEKEQKDVDSLISRISRHEKTSIYSHEQELEKIRNQILVEISEDVVKD